MLASHWEGVIDFLSILKVAKDRNRRNQVE